VRVIEQDVVRELHVTRQMFDQATERELREVERRERAYREGRPLPDLMDATVILVDDGVATGATMLAAVYALRQLGPADAIAAAPVMSRQAYRTLAGAADQCVCVAMPEPFYGVGMHYRDFEQTSDEEVRAVLQRGDSAEYGMGGFSRHLSAG
jgi:predicted phosphoribosyltransferase